jgi:hypothetical protein
MSQKCEKVSSHDTTRRQLASVEEMLETIEIMERDLEKARTSMKRLRGITRKRLQKVASLLEDLDGYAKRFLGNHVGDLDSMRRARLNEKRAAVTLLKIRVEKTKERLLRKLSQT